MSRVLRGLGLGAATLAVLGAGSLVYANRVELTRFTLRRDQVPVPGLSRSLRLLHISDIHYVPGQTKKLRWLQSLAQLKPDVVINTGDNLSDSAAVPEVLEALEPLMQYPGAFVPGSNDYYTPRFRNPLRYFAGPSKPHTRAATLPTEELFAAFQEAGWADLANAHSRAQINEVGIEFSGVDDPHLDLDESPSWPDSRPNGDDAAAAEPQLRIGVAHSPMRRVLQAFADDGAHLVLAGHTHGGQVCLPSLNPRGGPALVTNSDLPAAKAKGLHTLMGAGGNTTWVHVSAGIGTSAKAPIRFFCPPEASLLTLTPA
ncbi:MAG: metallophosphoesterase [Nesterenkonia sp.]